jgi:hypothetical protein
VTPTYVAAGVLLVEWGIGLVGGINKMMSRWHIWWEGLVPVRIEEFDGRYAWTREAIAALENGLEQLPNDHDDGLDLLEYAEELVGLSFVTLQVYVSGTTTTLGKMFPDRPESVAEGLRSRNCPSVLGVPFVEGIWATGDYYKHHDEWPDWTPVKNKSKNTILTLGKLGITARTEFPCVETLKVLQGGWGRLVGLLEVASAWREASFSELCPPADGT